MSQGTGKNKEQKNLVPKKQQSLPELPPDLKAIIDQIPKEKREQALAAIISFKLTIFVCVNCLKI